jgi:ribosomal RNA-processing protein 36
MDAELCDCSPSTSAGTSDMSFEELLELQNQVGTKAYKQLVAGNSTKKQSSRQPSCVADKHR